jgi:hypothetical protein
MQEVTKYRKERKDRQDYIWEMSVAGQKIAVDPAWIRSTAGRTIRQRFLWEAFAPNVLWAIKFGASSSDPCHSDSSDEAKA